MCGALRNSYLQAGKRLSGLLTREHPHKMLFAVMVVTVTVIVLGKLSKDSESSS